MRAVTAIILSKTREASPRTLPGCAVLERIGEISTPAQFCAARLAAVREVRSRFFFFLDDDDDLPADYRDVLESCIAQRAAVAYTDRLVDGELVRSAIYSQAAHLKDPRLVHHLALFETRAAVDALARLPRGDFYPEMLLAWEVAKRGAAHVERVGYHWNRSSGGRMHLWPQISIAQMRSILWCKDHP